MTLLCFLIRTFAMLLFMAFGVSADFAAQGDGAPTSYFVVVQELEVQPAKLAPTARAPPTNRLVLTNNDGAFVQTDKLRVFYDVASFGDASAILGCPNAPNRTVTDFVDGVTVVDRRTGTTFTGTVDLRPTLHRIETGGRSPVGRNDGAVFQNRPVAGRTEPELPVQPQGYYTEYVHPTPGVSGPGPQRIVTGAGGEIYYTPDHYSTFIRLDR